MKSVTIPCPPLKPSIDRCRETGENLTLDYGYILLSEACDRMPSLKNKVFEQALDWTFAIKVATPVIQFVKEYKGKRPKAVVVTFDEAWNITETRIAIKAERELAGVA